MTQPGEYHLEREYHLKIPFRENLLYVYNPNSHAHSLNVWVFVGSCERARARVSESAAAHGCECVSVCPGWVRSTVRWGADLRGTARLVSVCCLPPFRGLALDKRTHHQRDFDNEQ